MHVERILHADMVLDSDLYTGHTGKLSDAEGQADSSIDRNSAWLSKINKSQHKIHLIYIYLKFKK